MYTLAVLGGNLTKFTSLDDAAQKLLNIATLIAALVAVGVLIYGGIMYIISTGDSSKTEKAQNTIIYALVGLVVVGLAWLVVGFILKALGLDDNITTLDEATQVVTTLLR